ncbi:MAG: hypothetical protein AAGG11_14255 [Pseudomonadota bacterium]
MRIIRGVMLKHATLTDLQTPFLALTVFTGIVIGIAMLRYRTTLD